MLENQGYIWFNNTRIFYCYSEKRFCASVSLGGENMELSQIRQFLVVARIGNITHAAKSLYISQSTLSGTISRLENDLGVKLFDRNGNKIELNKNGKLFQYYMENIIPEFDKAVRIVRDTNDLQSEAVQFAIPHSGMINSIKERFLTENPDIHLRQHIMSAQFAKSLLLNGVIHFAILFAPIYDPSIEWKELCEMRFIPLVHETNPLAKKRKIHLRDLKSQNILIATAGSDVYNIFTEFCRNADFTPNISFIGDEPDLVLQLIRNPSSTLILPIPTEKTGVLSQPYEISKNEFLIPLHITDVRCAVTLGIARQHSGGMPKYSEAFYDLLCSEIPRHFYHDLAHRTIQLD